MAKRSSTRRTHVSPGIYYKETEIPYATKSLGITTLGLAGETVKGPAFQPISISDWNEFKSYFGGTNTEKFRGSQYPKYELPYIAQEYLKQSKQLEVVRTLGFSGVNAGPAWLITATKHNCVSGYQYTQSLDDDDKPIKYNGTISEVGMEVDGFYSDGQEGFISFNVPESVSAEEGNLKKEIGVVDAHINTEVGILYFDEDNYPDSFAKDTIVPKGLMLEFEDENVPVSEMIKKYAEEHNWGDSFLFVNLEEGENYIKTGKIAIEYNHPYSGEKGIVALFDIEKNEPTQEPHENNGYDDEYDTFVKNFHETKDGESVDHYYIVIPRSVLESKLKDMFANYEPDTNFSINSFKVYQYDYTDNTDSQIVEESGNVYLYTSNDEPTTVCLEDTESEYNNVVIAVLRSRGEHKKATATGKLDECGNMIYTYDGIDYYAKKVTLEPSDTLSLEDSCNPGYNTVTGDFNVNTVNYGKFTIAVDYVKGCENCGIDSYAKNKIDVSLNPSDKNYILKVLGTDPEDSDKCEVYVEELYDIALEQLIYAGEINAINHELVYYPDVYMVPEHAPVDDLLTISEKDINNKRYAGKRYLYTLNESLNNNIRVKVSEDNGTTWTDSIGIPGHIYTVIGHVDKNSNKKEYFYGEYRGENNSIITTGKNKTEFLTVYNFKSDVIRNNNILGNCVKVKADDMYYVLVDIDEHDTAMDCDVMPITLDFNNYKDAYRYASTPWVVSEMKGSGSNVNLHKLFRFHTISDGNTANTEVKISIENIDPEMETFDVVVRSFYDSDVNPNAIERFGKCCLTPGEPNYIGLKIGSFDEVYAPQSAYITVEINEDDITSQSIPCGFLGYPVRNYNGFGIYDITDGKINGSIKQPYLQYNTFVDEEIKAKKQYFGMSDTLGIDADILSYKGIEAYNDDPNGLTPCFHLDSRILNGTPSGEENGQYYVMDDRNNKQFVSVDGITGYNWVTVDKTNYYGDNTIEPRIGTEDVMEGTIYEDKNYRKFTLCFYGGWDGWDYYRTSRSNSDEYRYNKYKGSINKVSGMGTMFSVIKDPETYGFDAESKVITSDYYAYLAAVKQLDNPKTVSINLFATPGIDYVNQTALVNDIIDIVEEERGDTLYVVTTPDKPFGAGDSKTEMYTPEEVVYNLEDTEIDTNFACTYYPWEKYYDADNNQYIYLPVTRDVLRNMAYTDNVKYPWYASAGWNRGDISGVEPKRKLKLAEQDTLYEGRINFINSFAKEGDRIWGDKNLQVHDGIMNRISKRRLLIRLKNLLSTACVGLLFDPNDPSMVDTFKSCVAAVLDPIKSNRGITDYKIEVDDSAEARDRLELPAKIWIKPTQMLEYIDIQLVVTPQGVSWE